MARRKSLAALAQKVTDETTDETTEALEESAEDAVADNGEVTPKKSRKARDHGELLVAQIFRDEETGAVASFVPMTSKGAFDKTLDAERWANKQEAGQEYAVMRLVKAVRREERKEVVEVLTTETVNVDVDF